MEIKLVKHPFDYRKFSHVLKYDREMENGDISPLASRVCKRLTEKTKVKWKVVSCVGGKCNIETTLVTNREIRRRLRGKNIIIEDVPFFE